jgi:hypothetical protein
LAAEPDPFKGRGYVKFAAAMLMLGSVFTVVDGIIALSKPSFDVTDAHYPFGNLHTWGWILIGLGILLFAAALSASRGGTFGRWFGIGAAGLHAIGVLLAAQHYPLYALVMFALDVLIIYALAVYGGRPELVD